MDNCVSAVVQTTRNRFLALLTSDAFVSIAMPALPVFPAGSQQNSTDLISQSLEDLLNVQVTSVSKKRRNFRGLPRPFS